MLSFTAPSAEVVIRGKCALIFHLLACAMEPKLVSAVDAKGQPVEVQVRCGRAVEDLLAAKPHRLVGFALHEAPVIAGPG